MALLTPSSTRLAATTDDDSSKAEEQLSRADLNRVQEELEKLNIATDVINKLELQLDEARAAFREIQSRWSQRLEQLGKKLGQAVERARPYYEARLQLRNSQEDAQKAAIRFERANSLHRVAKQQVSLTQDSLNRQQRGAVEPACLEVLNHHIQRVNDAEEERLKSEMEHERRRQVLEEATRRVQSLEKEIGRQIKKSRPYFDARVEFTRVLEQQKALIQRLEAEIRQKKADYTTSLRNLEQISERIHEERQLSVLTRESGVGAEDPGPPVSAVEVRLRSFTDSTSDDQLTELKSDAAPQLFRDGDSAAAERRDRSVSAPADPDQFLLVDAAEGVLTPRARLRPANLGSGVILLAQQLTDLSKWFPDERRRKAFSYPPEEIDLQYHTAPEGVKRELTPPLTPAVEQPRLLSPTSPDAVSRVSAASSNADSESGFGSVDEDCISGMLRDHSGIIQEIDESAERAKRLSAGCHQRSVSDLPDAPAAPLDHERSSGSGESSTEI